MLQLLTADVDVSARTQAETDAIWFSWFWFFAAAAAGEAETIAETTADAAVLAETACGFWSCSAAAAAGAETASAANSSTSYAEIKNSDWAEWGCRTNSSWAALFVADFLQNFAAAITLL